VNRRVNRGLVFEDIMLPTLSSVVAQPVLPARRVVVDTATGKVMRKKWPEETLAWWAAWSQQPIAVKLTALDWATLAETALLHASVWGDGNYRALPELRLRVAAFGVTPKMRENLRKFLTEEDGQFPDAEAPRGGRARDRLAPLILLKTGTEG
jgi:hypothetical protein